MTITIHTGHSLTVLKGMPDASINCCVTSPPYWNLRDYGIDGQIGLEPTVDAYLQTMVDIFEEVRRVLTDDGTLWLNLGDCYAGSGIAGTQALDKLGEKLGTGGGKKQSNMLAGRAPTPLGLKPKDLVGIPWRVAFALQSAGWYLRRDIIWNKANPMPESVKDRPANAHEYIFLMSKSARYYYDAEAVREPRAALEQRSDGIVRDRVKDYDSKQKQIPRPNNGVGFGHGTDKEKRNRERVVPRPSGWATSGSHKTVDWATEQQQGRRERGNAKTFRGGGAYTDGKSRSNSEQVARESHGNAPPPDELRNLRDVWTIATQPFPEAHFATYPPKLVEPCILAGSRPGDTILDPFFGAGTTGLVADRLGRHCVGIELNPQYVDLARRRLISDGGMLMDIKCVK